MFVSNTLGDTDVCWRFSARIVALTAAAAAGVSERAIMKQTGHKSLPMVRRYFRKGSLFTENAAAEVGL